VLAQEQGGPSRRLRSSQAHPLLSRSITDLPAHPATRPLQEKRAQTIRQQAALNLASEGKSKAEVSRLLKHGVGPAVNLMETKGYESYKPPAEIEA
jgi:hypothetical protein